MRTKLNFLSKPESSRTRINDLDRGDWFVLLGEIYVVYDRDPKSVHSLCLSANIPVSHNVNTQNYEVNLIKDVNVSCVL